MDKLVVILTTQTVPSTSNAEHLTELSSTKQKSEKNNKITLILIVILSLS